MIPKLEINSLCVSCDNCRIICPDEAVFYTGGKFFVDNWSCTLCMLCVQVCPTDAIKLTQDKSRD